MIGQSQSPDIAPPTGSTLKRRLLVAEAERWVGIREQGPCRGQIVELFQAWNGRVDRAPWCMAFVQYCLKHADQLHDCLVGLSCPTRHGIFATEHVMTAWDRTPKHHRRQTPAPGLLAVWQRVRDGLLSQAGHTGIVTEAGHEADSFVTVEGNTSISLPGGAARGVRAKRHSRHPAAGSTLRLRGFLDPYEG